MRLKLALAMASLLLLPVSADCQPNAPRVDSRMWTGTVRFNYSRTSNLSSSGASDERKTAEANCSSVITAYAEMKVCPTARAQWSAREYQRHSQSNTRWSDKSKPCMKGVTKREDIYFPVSRGSSQLTETGKLAEDVASVPPEVRLVVWSDGTYSLSAAGALSLAIRSSDSQESRDGCSGDQDNRSITDEPAVGGKQRKRMVVNGRTLLDVEHSRSGVTFPLAVAHKGRVNGKMISGKLPLISRHDVGGPGDFPCWKQHGTTINERNFSEDLLADWEFKVYDACPEVREAFLNAWALYKAYTNDALLKAAEQTHMSGQEFDALVGKTAAAARGEEAGGGDWRAVDELGTGADCKTGNIQEWIDQKHRECVPQAIIDAGLEHEKAHREQCEHDRQRFGKAGPAEYHDFEGDAYAVGLRILFGWLKEHCPDFDLQPYRAELFPD